MPASLKLSFLQAEDLETWTVLRWGNSSDSRHSQWVRDLLRSIRTALPVNEHSTAVNVCKGVIRSLAISSGSCPFPAAYVYEVWPVWKLLRESQEMFAVRRVGVVEEISELSSRHRPLKTRCVLLVGRLGAREDIQIAHSLYFQDETGHIPAELLCPHQTLWEVTDRTVVCCAYTYVPCKSVEPQRQHHWHTQRYNSSELSCLSYLEVTSVEIVGECSEKRYPRWAEIEIPQPMNVRSALETRQTDAVHLQGTVLAISPVFRKENDGSPVSYFFVELGDADVDIGGSDR